MKGDYPDYRVEAEEGRQNRLDLNFTAHPQPPPPVAFQVTENTIHGSVCLLNRYRVLTMKYNLRAKDLVQSEANHDNNSSPTTQCSLNIIEKVPVSMSPIKSYLQEQTTSSSVENVMSDTSTGLTQRISGLTINDDMSCFLIPVGTILFYPDRKDNLYKVSILEHDLVRSKVRYLQWGPNYDEWVCSKSIWAYSQFTQLLSTVKKIPKDLSVRIDELVQSATLGSGSSGPNDNPSKLPDLKTICSKNIPMIRYIPVKFRMPWSGIITSIIEDCISNPDCVDNWKKFFAVSKCVLRASNRGGKKHKQQQENSMMNRFERWRSGEYAALWYEAASLKQAKNKSNSTMEALASRAKALCLQGQFGRAAKILSSEGIAPDNRKTLIELKKNCIQRKTKFLSRWKTIAAKLINSMRKKSSCSSSLFRNSQQLGHPKCTQSIFSTQSIVQFLINPSVQ